MHIVMVDGGPQDEAQLLELVHRAGFEARVSRVSLSQLDVQITSGLARTVQASPVLPSTEASRDAAARPRALLFETLDRPERAAAVLGAVRVGPYFDAVPAIVSLTIDRVDWFEVVHGFDDFVLHPCSPAELLGRIQSAERRRSELGPDAVVQIGGILMDKIAREAQVDGRSVHLTAREFALLAYLCVRRGRVLSRDHLLQHVWGHAYHGGPRTVDVHIRRLRSKLGTALAIDTVRSGGYRLRSVNRSRSIEHTLPPHTPAPSPPSSPGLDRRSLSTFAHASPGGE